MRLSPEVLDKVRKFKQNRRAYYSLRILSLLFLLTLPAELIFNNRPIVMHVDGAWFFPVFRDYTYADLGGDEEIPVVSYNSDMFDNFVAGRSTRIDTEALFGGGEFILEDQGAVAGSGAPVSRDVWALWPPILGCRA